jgi:hypothetical protein
MATITRRWKRVLAFGCNHGELADPIAVEKLVEFKKKWKPDITIHLGDNFDSAAFRSGAKGTPDEGEPILQDLEAGFRFLDRLEPDYLTLGNHEARFWDHLRHHNAIVQMCAEEVVRRIETKCALLKIKVTPYDVEKNWVKLGGYHFGHGFAFGANYLQNTAKVMRRAVVAHAHVAGQIGSPSIDGSHVIGVGTLCNQPAMGYARRRFNTLAWSAGWCYGEVCDDDARLHLFEQPRWSTEWRFPI